MIFFFLIKDLELKDELEEEHAVAAEALRLEQTKERRRRMSDQMDQDKFNLLAVSKYGASILVPTPKSVYVSEDNYGRTDSSMQLKELNSKVIPGHEHSPRRSENDDDDNDVKVRKLDRGDSNRATVGENNDSSDTMTSVTVVRDYIDEDETKSLEE